MSSPAVSSRAPSIEVSANNINNKPSTKETLSSLVDLAKSVGRIAGAILVLFTIATQPLIFVAGITAGWVTKHQLQDVQKKAAAVWNAQSPHIRNATKLALGVAGLATLTFGVWPLLTLSAVTRALPFATGFGIGSYYKDSITNFVKPAAAAAKANLGA